MHKMFKVTCLADPQRKAWDSSKAWSWKSSKNGSGAALPNVKYTQNQSICKKQVLMNA
jgi:hypothetical protein